MKLLLLIWPVFHMHLQIKAMGALIFFMDFTSLILS